MREVTHLLFADTGTMIRRMMHPVAPTDSLELADPVDLPGTSLKVLVVEDDRPTRLLLERMIRGRGHDVHGCDSAEQARELLGKTFYPLIVLDIQLPGMNGLDFSRLLREHPQGKFYYILAGTGNNRPDDLRQILDAGADDYIGKPYHPGLLDVRLAVAEAAVKDIAERRRLEYDLEFLADHDPLTKLFNRRKLPLAVGDAVAEARAGRSGALLYIDLDNFKVVNDTLGHEAGDRLLLTVADILRSTVRADDILVRFGGDEFVIILPDCPVSDALNIGEGLRENIENLVFAEEGRTFRVGASIGIVPIDGSRESSDVLGVADAACYAAKAGGRNRVELYRETGGALETLVADNDWSSRIKNAMRDGTLGIYFQPVVAIAGRTILCHEVLLRLSDRPESAPVHPAAFMSAVQRSGQTAKLDRFVISRAVESLLGTPDAHLSINISGSSFANADFADYVEATLVAHSVGPERIIFELTENEVIANLVQAQSVMTSLRKRGFRFALDDFGTGTSSMNYLKSLPVDMIKIEGSFVRHLDADPFNQAVVRAVQALAAALKIPLVAEYVESRAVFDLLAKMGVEYIQGYLAGEPRTTPYSEDELFASQVFQETHGH
ncbi:MAG: EAL domain-containing protein [Verrucomicrobia bacterium]|nr:EAL domain-containing protein [Verrucomicrobiota bacterium]